MSVNVMYDLNEEKQEMQKQLGCMNGIFQLFDRRYLLGQRRHGHNQKKLLQGENDDGKKEFNNESRKPTEKTSNKVVKEKHRVSVESSRNSFSSSCSSLDCSKRLQTEPSSFCPSIISEPSSPTSHKKQPDLLVEPADIRDVVKDSMTRKPRMVSVKTVAKDERKGPTMTHVDSPRPLQHPKPVPYDRKDQNLAKLREISRGVKEVKEISRFSCDGRESPYKLKSIANIKEIPRLSLDSKQSSIRNRTNVVNEIHEPGSNKRPSSGVVARLMGLEVLSDFINGGEPLKIKPCLDDNSYSPSKSSKTGKESKRNVSVSPRARNELASPRRGIDKTMTRIPLEPAPWKQEGQKLPTKIKKALERTDHGCHSIYGQIEKRLTEVEFKTSGKDLRALKQILEAIQRTKIRLENTEHDLDHNSSDHKETAIEPGNLTSNSMVITSLQKVRKVNHADGSKYTAGRRSARSITPVETRAASRSEKSASPECLTGQSYCSSRNSGTVSPRVQRSKNGMEKQSVHGIRKQSNGQLTVPDSNTTNSKNRSKNQLQTSYRSCRYSSLARNSNQQGDASSFPSESDNSVASQNESEVISTDWTPENRNKFAERLVEYKPMTELAMLTVEQPSPVSVLDAFGTEDIPSPIQKKSFAFKDDGDLYFDESEWNEVKIDNLVSSTEPDQSSSGFNHIDIENIKHLVRQIKLFNSSSDETITNPQEEINEDHQYIKEILLASGFLKNLDCATAVFHLHPASSLINPELFDILEKPQDCNKNNRFSKSKRIRRKLIFDTVNNILVQKLERSAFSGSWPSKRKQRILNGEKLLKELCSEINILQTITPSGVYDEVLNIINADVNKQSEDWDNNRNEVPALVLDIERLIFKDLVSEIVNAEVACQQNGQGRHHRQLSLV